MSESLVTLATKNKLPLLQLMDSQTLSWIKKNKPFFKDKDNVKLPTRKTIQNFIPNKEWFFKKQHVNSIHGYRHLLRAALWALLSAKIKKYKGNIDNLLVAAVLHDIRRRHDKDDKNHGMRSAIWMKKNISKISKKFKIKFNKKDIREIYWLIIFHELPYHKIKNNVNYLKFKEGINIIRMADALDRYRLPKLKWWIDEKKLGIKIKASMKHTAFNFIVLSEKYFLKNKKSIESILKNLK